MSVTNTLAMALLRVERGAPAPSEDDCRKALAADQEWLGIKTAVADDVEMTGPHPLTTDGRELDEYVIWER